MSDATLTRDGEIIVIDFGDDENRTDVAWVAAVDGLLDEAHAVGGAKVLVTTGGGKHYSNGLDVEWMAGRDSAEIRSYVGSVERLIGRILTFPAPTVAAVNGHAFGAGAFLVLAHDHVVMRADRGYVCWPEVHLGMTFSPALMAMLKGLLPVTTSWEATVTGRRYGAAEAVQAGFVDRAVPFEELMPTALELGQPLAATAGPTLGKIKQQFHRAVIDALPQT